MRLNRDRLPDLARNSRTDSVTVSERLQNRISRVRFRQLVKSWTEEFVPDAPVRNWRDRPAADLVSLTAVGSTAGKDSLG